MARAPNEKAQKAKEMFCQGMRPTEIAKHLEVPEGTVRRWKHTYGWERERSEKNTERSDKNTERSEKKKRSQEEAVAGAVDQVMENDGLTDKQRLFCILYVRSFNATKAYQKAYGVDYNTAASIAYRLLEKDGVKNEIQRLKKNRLNREMIDEHDIFQRYMDIAFADITDYVTFGREQVPVMGPFGPIRVKDKNGRQVELKKEVNVVKFRESEDVDGTIISEVKQGKDGASIKLADRMKALQWLSDHIGIATDEQKARIAVLKAKVQDSEIDEAEDDGFLDALNGSAKGDWSDEDETDNV